MLESLYQWMDRWFGLNGGYQDTEIEDMKQPKFVFWKSDAGDWRWHLKATNGEIQAQGEGYKTKVGVQRGIDALKRNALVAKVVEA